MLFDNSIIANRSLLQSRFVSFAFAAAIGIFVLVEYMRVSRVPPIGDRVQSFVQVI